MQIHQFSIEKKNFFENPFEVVKFWYTRKNSFLMLSRIAMRTYATPASSCSSQRVFSVLNKIASQRRRALSTERLSHIIVAR